MPNIVHAQNVTEMDLPRKAMIKVLHLMRLNPHQAEMIQIMPQKHKLPKLHKAEKKLREKMKNNQNLWIIRLPPVA